MKPLQFSIIAAALILIGVGVWYPIVQRQRAAAFAAAEKSKHEQEALAEKHRRALICAWDAISTIEKFEIPETAPGRVDYAAERLHPVWDALIQSFKNCDPGDREVINPLEDLLSQASTAMLEDDKKPGDLEAIVRKVSDANDQLAEAKEALRARLDLASK